MFISKKTVIVLLAAAAIGISFAALSKRHISEQAFAGGQIVVAVDSGHGSPDGGAVGVSGTLEKDINLDIALKLEELLSARGNKVIMTREGDSGLHDGTGTIREKKIADMKKRVEIINNSNADLFISIHMNSLDDSTVSGLHLFYTPGDEDIKPLAESIQESLAEATGAAAHDIRPASPSLYLMKYAEIPGILIECGFLSNPDEERLLKSDAYRSRIAWGIAQGLPAR